MSDDRLPDPTSAPTSRWTFDGPAARDVVEVRRLRIRIGRGEIDVIGRDEPGASIELRSMSGLPLDAGVEGDMLWIGSEWDGGAGSRAAMTVFVHRDAAVAVEVVSAEVLVSGVKRGFRVRTVSGGVVCDATAGQAQLEGTSGELSLREHEGAVDVATVSGPVTASGAVSRFDCDGVSADVFLDLEAPEGVKVRSVSGAIVLRLGEERSADYTIRTISGDVEVDGSDIGRARGGYRGTWSGPGGEPTRVQLETASGTVRVVHAGDL